MRPTPGEVNPDRASSDACSTDINSNLNHLEQMMLQIVHDRVTTGVTTVVGTAAILQCEKQMEKLTHY